MPESLLRATDRVEDRIRLHRQGDQRPLLVVEGPDDELVLRSHFQDVTFFPAGGRANAITASIALTRWKFRDFVVIVDTDYLGPPPKPVRVYSGRDLEAMLVELGALEIVIESLGSREKVSRVGGAAALVYLLVKEAEFLSRLRAVNAKDGLGLPFDSVDVAKKMDQTTLKLARRELCQALLSKSDSDLSADELLRMALAVEDDGLGPSGKDVTILVGVALRKMVGSLPHTAAHPDVLLPHLRSGASLLIRESAWLKDVRLALASK